MIREEHTDFQGAGNMLLSELSSDYMELTA